MELLTHDFYYDLPEELIAQTPVEPRDASRLLVYSRADESVEHAHFRDLPDYLEEGDLLVINNTKVIPARIFGHMEGKATTFELLLLKRLDYTRWETIMRPARKARKGSVIKISDELSAEVEEVGEYGVRTVKFDFDGVFEDILDRVGNMPLPPYIPKPATTPCTARRRGLRRRRRRGCISRPNLWKECAHAARILRKCCCT